MGRSADGTLWGAKRLRVYSPPLPTSPHLSTRPPRTVPSSLGRGGEVGVFHLLVDYRGERPARERGSELVAVGGAPSFYSRSTRSPWGGRKRETEAAETARALPLPTSAVVFRQQQQWQITGLPLCSRRY